MVLRIEGYSPVKSEWFHMADVKPGTTGSFPDNRNDGGRDVIVFNCDEDNSRSTVSKSPIGVDVEYGNKKILLHDKNTLEILKELKDGEEYSLDVRTDNSPREMTIRFSHIQT